MNADKSVAALLYAIVVCVTISRSTNNENSMDDRDDDVRGVMSSRGSVLRQRPRSASIGHLHSASTQQRTNEPSDDRKQRYHVGLFDCGYVSTPFILSLWIMLSSVAKTGQLIFGYHRHHYETYKSPRGSAAPYNKISTVYPRIEAPGVY